MYGICNLTLAPMRAEPSHRSEMVNQLLFGEHFEILEQRNEWMRIKNSYDSYEGWMLQSQCAQLEFRDYDYLGKTNNFLSYDLVQILITDPTMCSIVLGSTLPFLANNVCAINNTKYRFDGNAKIPEPTHTSQTIIENAYMYLNSPYLWGGRTPFGIDCSGFTQMVFKLCGIKLLRDTYMQAEQGFAVNLLDEAHPGDLAFFDNAEGKIIHVGIITSGNKVIHSSGKVRIDMIDHHGIFNNETKKYSHNLRLIKRFI